MSEEKLADIELTDIFNDKTLADMIEAIDLDAEEEYEYFLDDIRK